MHLFANVGFTPEVISPSIRSRPDLRGVSLFYGTDPQAADAVGVVESETEELGISVRTVLVDVFNAVDAFNSYLKEYQRLKPPREIVFNMAGGTGIVTSAATAFCAAMDIPMVYVRRDTGQEVAFPRSVFGYWYRYLPSHTDVLRAIRDGSVQVRDIAVSTKISQGRVSVLVQDLEKGQFVVSKRTGRDKLLAITDFAQLVLDVDALRKNESTIVAQ